MKEQLRQYTLTATLGKATNTFKFEDINDDEAMFAAIKKILDTAIKSRLWQKGEIVLAGPDGVIKTMPAKASS